MTSEANGTFAPARARWRAVDGIVLLDKPEGWSSNHALQRVRRVLRARKAGHAGTLDPMATGMLPLCFGQGTKACGSLLGERKAYAATITLGTATVTGDREGAVSSEAPVPAFTALDLEHVAAALSGSRLQVPPMHSALKRDGQPLYVLARRGVTVERAARPITIEEMHLERVDGEHRLRLAVTCSKGTYVRVLGEEVAQRLGTVGHLTSLRRLWVEPFRPDDLVTMETVEATAELDSERGAPPWLLPVDTAFPHLPSILLDATQALFLRQGRVLAVPGLEAPAGRTIRAYDDANRFLGLVDADGRGGLRVRRLFVPGADGTDGLTT